MKKMIFHEKLSNEDKELTRKSIGSLITFLKIGFNYPTLIPNTSKLLVRLSTS